MKTRATRPFPPTPFRGAALPACALMVLCVSLPPAFAASAASPNSSRSPTASPNSGVATGAAGTGDTIGNGPGTASANNSTGSTSANGGSVLKWSDRHFVNEVADGNHQEIIFAQLAAQQATDPGVRNYAQKLMSDHLAMGRDLMQLAQQKGVTLDSDVSNYSANAAWNSTYDRTGASNSRMISGSSPNDMNNYDSSKSTANGGTPGRTVSGATSPGNSSTASTATDSTNDRARATAGMSANSAASPSMNSGTAAANSASAPAGVNGAGQYTGTPASMGDQSTSGPGLGWWGDRQYRRLAKENGADFDRDFIARMVDDHEKDVKMFEKKASDANDPDVRAFAAKQLPTLRQHLSQAQNLAQNEK